MVRKLRLRQKKIKKKKAMYILCKAVYSKKLEKRMLWVYFVKILGLQTTAYLKQNSTKTLCNNFDEGVVCNIYR